MMRAKGFSIRFWVVGLILFSGVIGMFFLTVGSMAAEYNAEANVINEDLEERYGIIDQTTATAETLRSVAKQDEGLTLIGGFRVLFRATTGVLNTVLNSLTILPAVFLNAADDFNLDGTIVATLLIIIFAIITTLIVFEVVSAGSGGRV